MNTNTTAAAKYPRQRKEPKITRQHTYKGVRYGWHMRLKIWVSWAHSDLGAPFCGWLPSAAKHIKS